MKKAIKSFLARLVLGCGLAFAGCSGLESRLDEQRIPPEFTKRCLSLGFSQNEAVFLHKTTCDIEKIAEFKRNGALVSDAFFLTERKVPIEYYNQRKDELDIFSIFRVYNSSLKNVKISKKSIAGFKIEYKDFNELEVKDDEEREIPRELNLALLSRSVWPRIDNKDKFQNSVMTTASELEYDLHKIQNLNPKEAIKLSVDIVCRRLEYKLVDKDGINCDEEFIRKYGEHLSHDRYFELGFGDCDKYAALTSAVFSVFRGINPRLKNTYICPDIGGHFIPHAWNSVVVLGRDKITFSQIDPTWYESSGKLEAGKEHLDKRKFNTTILGECERFTKKRK